MKRMFTNLGLLQIFFSLMLVISIMFGSTYYVYKNSISGIYEKVSQNNNLVVKSIVQSFDNSFKSVNNLIYSIHGLPPYDNLVFPEDDLTDMSKVYDLVENLSTLVSSLDYIEEVLVYYDNANLAITSKGTSSFPFFFNNLYKHQLYNADYWKAYLLSKHSFKIFPAETFRISSEFNQQVWNKKLLVVVDGNKARLSNKNVMILMNVEKLMKHVNQKSMIPGASLIVLDQDRNIIHSTEETLDLMEVLNDVYFNASQEASLTREDYEYNFYKSEYNGFIYIDKVPYQFQNIDSVATANYRIMLTAIISAIVLSFFLSIYLNNPVKNILRLLGGGNSNGNDFRKIHSGIVKIQMDNESYKNQLSFVESELRRGVFLQALDEYAHTKEHSIQMQHYYPDFFRHKCFVMAALQLNQIDNEQSLSLTVEEIVEMIQRAFKRDKLDANVFHVKNLQFLVVMGLEQVSVREKLIKRLRSSVTLSESEELLGFSVWVCISKVYTSEIDNFKRAYWDVMNGRMYRNVNDDVNVIDVEDIQFKWDIYYPFEHMEKLANYILNRKITEAIHMIKEIMQENAERNIHHHQLVHIAKTMFFYMLRHAGGSANVNNELYKLEINFFQKIEDALSYRDVENALIVVTKYIGNQNKPEFKNKLNPAFVSQYIELHYMENLYLDDIAEVLETSPKYFSNYFKKTFGINYVEYLNKVRLSHARELLRDTNASIAEVGEKTGYQNASTFTTTFKKYYGISPSEYRKHSDVTLGMK
ncbi:AraC family transcriptional regulator [Paenibacillus nasutitermitis]|uniref:HTH-type transcriptional regulator YesS n=1 Tax=Paenibacillus nasutitermitis TaxID=1652958 RepID=A0A916Z991_9BACL|nr:helix-turn-helix domain-containing protein [Paenibacillus nasutitermitis]GGD82514.1 HTH-type transcriptional regulator YesS [Paenibacillus nasutitermitis]